MIIYYTHSFGNTKGESHSLLAGALEHHLREAEPGCADPHGRAQMLVQSMQKSGEFGKPFIPGFVPFSISHSAGTWAVLISESEGFECGLDIQYVRNVDAVSVAERFFAPEDAGLIREAPEFFFRLWTRREALVKAAGKSVAGTDIPAVNGSAVLFDGSSWRIDDVSVPGDGLYSAICVRRPDQGESIPERLIIHEL